MAGVGEKDATRSDKEAEEGSQAQARPFEERYLRKFFPGRGPGDIEILRTKLNDAEYPIRSGRRGKCVIFNYKDFQASRTLKNRSGTEEDVRQLSLRFDELGFKVITHSDLTARTTFMELEKHGGDDYTQDDCFVCWILTHADDQYNHLYAVDGGILDVHQFMKPFCENRGLHKKPKLFFIQACGDAGVGTIKVFTTPKVHFSGLTCGIPAYADSLVACSTIPGYFSWGDEASGSLFVQAFCCVLETSTGSEDLFAMLMEAFRVVALSYKENNPSQHYVFGPELMPYVTSTLTRSVRFPRVRQHEESHTVFRDTGEGFHLV